MDGADLEGVAGGRARRPVGNRAVIAVQHEIEIELPGDRVETPDRIGPPAGCLLAGEGHENLEPFGRIARQGILQDVSRRS